VVITSRDGGRTFSRVAPTDWASEKTRPMFTDMADVHGIWVDPTLPGHLVIASDRGVFTSRDTGVVWQRMETLPATALVYRIDADRRPTFYHVYATIRDMDAFGGPHRTRYVNGVTPSDWYTVRGGENSHLGVDPLDTTIVYTPDGIARFDLLTDQVRTISPPRPIGELEVVKSNITSPSLVSAFDHRTLYFGADRVFKTTDLGEHWRPISPVFTQPADSVRLMGIADQANPWGQFITALAESPIERGVFYVGTPSGTVQVTRNDGRSWRATEILRGPEESPPVVAIVHRIAYGAAPTWW